MLKNIQVIENSSGLIIAEYPLVMEIIDAPEDELFKDAWQVVVGDGLVETDHKSQYLIEIVEYDEDEDEEDHDDDAPR